MEWVSAVGFGMFPLSDSGYTGTFQDQMHILSMVIVLLLSIISLSLIIISGIKSKNCRSYGIFAGIALGMMMSIMVKTAGKALEKKADRTPEEEDMLDMMLHGGERVRIQNLQGVISWYNGKR